MIRKKQKLYRKRKVSKSEAPSDNVAVFLSSGIDVKNRIINLFDDIDSDTVGMVIKGIQAMLSVDKLATINININTFGGCVYSSFGLYDYLRSIPCKVITTNMGCCMSGGFIIFLAGDERLMYENTVFMAHTVSSIAEGKVSLDLKSEKEECDKIHVQLCKILSENTNKTKRQWQKIIEFKDNYYRKSEALELGVVHKVIKRKENNIKEFING